MSEYNSLKFFFENDIPDYSYSHLLSLDYFILPSQEEINISKTENNKLQEESDLLKKQNISIKDSLTKSTTKNQNALSISETNTLPLKSKPKCPKLEKKDAKRRKYGKDNMLVKIKAYYAGFSLAKINSAIKQKNKYYLYQIEAEYNESINKVYIKNLMDKTFGEIYSKYPISKRYIKLSKKNKYINKDIINSIFKDENEKKAQELLNTTYKDFYKEFLKEENQERFLNDMRQKKNNSPDYLIELEKLSKNFIDEVLKGKERKSRKFHFIEID